MVSILHVYCTIISFCSFLYFFYFSGSPVSVLVDLLTTCHLTDVKLSKSVKNKTLTCTWPHQSWPMMSREASWAWGMTHGPWLMGHNASRDIISRCNFSFPPLRYRRHDGTPSQNPFHCDGMPCDTRSSSACSHSCIRMKPRSGSPLNAAPQCRLSRAVLDRMVH